ncbi:glycoside hydrolase family 31 protein [Aneurinibacillus tyrosinisolvens]|uniref:glycoside hydrolase family 31 protein n=1 Tax=Aneurinibacillus tyrosinisolvens TaxID=1443435 RepID=UPI00063F9B86|nr:glycoside hydrolase family 31 protein [Aneurinibacillus tyrosinisolvens]
MDSSFAIHPEGKKQLRQQKYWDIGSLQAWKDEGSFYRVICERGHVDIVFFREDIVRIIMNPRQIPSHGSSPAVVLQPGSVPVRSEENEQAVVLTGTSIMLKLFKNPLRLLVLDKRGNILMGETGRGMAWSEKGDVICYKDMEDDDCFYGLGEKTGFLNKRGEKYTMWNSDVYAPHNPETDAMYQSIPYFMTMRNGKAHGLFFDNTYKTIFDMKTEQNAYSFRAEGGQLDYYIFAGPAPKNVVEQFTALTGRMPLPPKWALGYHQSRYSYETAEEVLEIARGFREREIPCDAIHLDIHHMDGYRVFSFDREAFPDPASLMKQLKEYDIRVVPIVDPGVKEDPEYALYREGIQGNRFCRYIEGGVFYGDVWPGNSAFPDFSQEQVRTWWGEQYRFYTDLGIEGIWNDMNEPAVFNETKTMDLKVMHDNDGEPKTHRELHNLYGMLMEAATYEGMKNLLYGRRPFVLTRAGFAGIQRYAAVWTGDNRSFWEHLVMSIPMCMNLGLSGAAFCGPDIGGFDHDANGELLARWTQAGAFTPFFRNHSAMNTVRQEPWSFGAQWEAVIKKYIELRYRWLPHLYTLFAQASQTGVPVMRPLLMEYPEDANTYSISDQFLIGENVLVAPVVTPSTKHRAVYLPKGTWYDYWTDRKHDGGRHLLVAADFHTLPMFIKEGAILAEGPVKQSAEIAGKTIRFHMYPGNREASSFLYYDDDGRTFAYEKGEFLQKRISCRHEADVFSIEIENVVERYSPSWETIEIMIHGADAGARVAVNGRQVPDSDITHRKEAGTLSFTLL